MDKKPHERLEGADPQYRGFLAAVLANRWNAVILGRAAQLGLVDWWLVSGCLVQTIWNAMHGNPLTHGIIDYDLFYFDADCSWEAEDAVIRRADDLFRDIPVQVQIRNQARVPLWYERKFAIPYPPLARACDAIDRFPCATTAIGVRMTNRGFDVHAPFGVEPAMQGILEPNVALPLREAYIAKTDRWRQIWPRLEFRPWPHGIHDEGEG